MRLFETFLVIASIISFITVTVPLFRNMRGNGIIILITLVFTLAQIWIEGPRWQMIPAYALTLSFLIIWLYNSILQDHIHINHTITIVSTGIGIIILLISTALPIIMPVFRFPQPSGPYAIGTVTYHWIDTSRPELFTPDPNDHRELMAQIWYPAKNEPSAPRAPYIEDADALTPTLARLTNMPDFLLTHLKYVMTNAVEAAPIADSKTSYPVLIYLTGLDGFRSASTFQIENLVSHGYIVVGLDQPGVSATVHYPDGRTITGWSRARIQPLIMQSVEQQAQMPTIYGTALPDGIIPYFAQDVSFTLDQLTTINKSDPDGILTGHIDLAHAGTFGISLGGMNAAEACLKDARLKACLIMDVYIPTDVVKAGLQQPTMFITRDANTMRLERQRIGGWSEHDIALTLGTMHTVYQNLPGDGYYIDIPNMFHLNFTDFAYWSPLTSLLGFTGPINGQRGYDIVNAYTLAFFNKELKNQPSSLLNGPAKEFPEANFATHRL